MLKFCFCFIESSQFCEMTGYQSLSINPEHQLPPPYNSQFLIRSQQEQNILPPNYSLSENSDDSNIGNNRNGEEQILNQYVTINYGNTNVTNSINSANVVPELSRRTEWKIICYVSSVVIAIMLIIALCVNLK